MRSRMKTSHFSSLHGLHPLPITEYHQTAFAAHLSLAVNWGTICSYLSAIRFIQIRVGLPDPTLQPPPRLSYVLRGIREMAPQHVRSQRLSITPTLLHSIHSLWSLQSLTFDRVMLWAALHGVLWIYAGRRIHYNLYRQPCCSTILVHC